MWKTKCHHFWQVRSWDDRQHVAGTPWNKPKPNAITRKGKTNNHGRSASQCFAWVADSFEITKLWSHVVDCIKSDVCIAKNEHLENWCAAPCSLKYKHPQIISNRNLCFFRPFLSFSGPDKAIHGGASKTAHGNQFGPNGLGVYTLQVLVRQVAWTESWVVMRFFRTVMVLSWSSNQVPKLCKIGRRNYHPWLTINS